MSRSTPLLFWLVLAFVAVVVLANTLFVVDQREQAVVLRFGEPVRVIHAPGQSGAGLNVKVPFLENVIKFDRRNLALEADQEEVIDANQQRLVVDAFLRYRISDPLQYYRTLRNEQIAQDRLERLVNSSLRQVLGSKVSMTDADETERATGFRPGGVCPFGLAGVEIVLDRDLGGYETVFPAAGNDATGVAVTLDQLARITGGRIADFGSGL